MELPFSVLQATLTVFVVFLAYLCFDYQRRLRTFADKVGRIRRSLKGRLGRPLAALEATMEHRNRAGVSMFSVAFFVKSREPLEEEALRGALTRIGGANPMLRMRIEGLGDGVEESMFFSEMEEFRPDLETLETIDWKAALEKEVSTPFDSAVGPLWRVKLLKDVVEDGTPRRVIIVTFHHAIADGKSALSMGDRLMDELSGENLSKWKTRFEDELPPSYAFVGDRAMGFNPMWKALLFLQLKFGFSSAFSPCSFATLTARPKMTTTTTTPPSRFITFKLGVDDLDELLRLCRIHGCKLHGTLQAVVSLAQIETFRRLRKKLPNSVNIRNIYSESVRDSLEPKLPTSVICYQVLICLMTRTIDSDAVILRRTFWSFAKSMSDEVHRRKREEPVDFLVKVLEFAHRVFPSFCVKHFTRITPETFRREEDLSFDYVMSNLGVFLGDCTRPRPFDISDAFVVGNIALSDSSFGHLIFSLRGRLHWTINFAENAFSTEETRVYAECVEEVLRKVVGGKIW